MDIGSILILFALLLLVGLFIARPILERKSSAVSMEEHELSSLLAERDRALTALQELDFDYKLGKIPEEDYPAQRALILQYGAGILRQLDAYQPQAAASSAEEQLEMVIAARRVEKTGVATQGGNGSNPALSIAPDDSLEVLIANRRRSRQGKTAGFCHQCGSPLQQSDHFCPRCGNKTA
jgi:hypothetical protein